MQDDAFNPEQSTHRVMSMLQEKPSESELRELHLRALENFIKIEFQTAFERISRHFLTGTRNNSTP